MMFFRYQAQFKIATTQKVINVISQDFGKAIETGMILFIDRVAADFFG